MNKYVVEALGAGVLTLVVGLSLAGTFPVSTPVLAALTVGLFVYSVGHVSGVHINPAVTIGVWSIGKIGNRDAFLYLVSQFIGASLALLFMGATITATVLTVADSSVIGLAELFGTFLLAFGIASVIYGKAPSSLSGVVIGGALLLGIAVAVLLGSNGMLNPAVAFGTGSLGIMYVLGPIIGAVLGMQAYKRLM